MTIGVDRLDKELTIAHMQGSDTTTIHNYLHYNVVGKFQLQVMSGCGHMVHEDNPDKVSCISGSHDVM